MIIEPHLVKRNRRYFAGFQTRRVGAVPRGPASAADRELTARLAARGLAGFNNLKDPDWDLTRALEDLNSYFPDAADKLARSFPDNSYRGNVFKNRSRCDQLVHDAGLID